MKDKISIGIDIGGTNIEIGWVNSDGKILNQVNYKTNKFKTGKEFANFIAPIILEENKKYDNILGIGIGAPNGNFFTGSIEFAPNLGWDHVIPLTKLFEQNTGLKTKLTNDANAAAYAEMIYGNAKQMKNFIVITLGTGLGSGIIVNGKMLYGSTGFAGELGHVIINEKGRQCGCGRKGCLETYVSATGIIKTTKELLTQSNSVLKKTANFEAKDIFSAALNGDKLALKAIEFTSKILGKAIADYTALFSPETVFLTGGLAKSHSLLIPSIKSAMNNNMLKIFKNTVEIIPSKLIDDNAGLFGAAAMMRQ